MNFGLLTMASMTLVSLNRWIIIILFPVPASTTISADVGFSVVVLFWFYQNDYTYLVPGFNGKTNQHFEPKL